MAYDKTKHDIGITHSGVVYGLMLAQKNGVPDYQTIIDEYLAQQMFMGAADYRDLPPEKELAFIRDNWRSGFGEDIADPADPERYFSSTGCDLRHKNMAILSWGLSALTLPTTTDPTITNPGFTTWDNGNCTGWTAEGAGSYTKDETTYRTTPAIELASDTSVYQDLATTQIKGRRFTATVYVHPAGVDDARIGLNDGNDTVWGAYNAGTGDWELVTVTRTLAQNASRLRIYLDIAAGDVCEFDDVTIARATYGTNKCSCDFGGNHYKSLGGLLTKLSATTLTGVYEFPSTITSLEPFGDGFMYIGLEATQVIEDCEDVWDTKPGANFTLSLDTGDFKVGSGSCKAVIVAGAGAGDIIAEPITSLNLSDYTGVKLWIKCSIATSAGDLCLLLDDTANCASPVETISLPALTAGQWTRVFVRLADPSLCTAIISVGLEYNVDIGACIIRIDDIKAESSYYYMDTGETLTQSTLAVATCDSFAKYFKASNSTMWKALEPNNLYSNIDPSNAGAFNWSTTHAVGSASYDITGLVSIKSSIYILKGDMPFYLEAGGAVEPLTEETSAIASITGGKNSTHWKGSLYMPYGEASLLEYDVNANLNWLDPSLYCTNLSAFDGQIQALAGDEQWLYIIVDNGASAVEILAGRLEAVGGGATWVWHPYQTLALTGCESACISSITQKRLYIASTDSTENLYYLPLPASYGNIASDTNKAFATGGYFETPWHHLNFKGDSKSFIKLTLNMESTTTSIYWRAYYMKKGDAGYTEIKNTDQTADGTGFYFKTSPATSGFIPEDGSSNKPTSTSMRFKFVGIGTTSSTPILKSYDIRAILYPSRRNIILCTVRCADDLKDKQGNPLDITASEIKTALEGARDATWPVTIKDIWGATKTVRVLPTQPFSQVSEADANRNIEEHYLLALQEVTLS